MEQKNIEASEVFMETVSLKLNQQDQKIDNQGKKVAVLEARLKEPPAWLSTLTEIRTGILSINTEIGKRQLPAEKIQELSSRLNTGLAIFSQPMKSEVIHHHHVSIGMWAAIGMFLILCLISSGWYMTAQKGQDSRANDFKYRHLKLAVDSAASAYLYCLDSLYSSNTDSFENAVIEQERLKREKFEILDRLGILNRKISDWKAGK
jgi:hypothetical protein